NREADGLYNAMIHPVKDYPVKGVLYYQAESNDQNPAEYETLFKTLINDWRTARGDMTLPFVFVQLPVWGVPGGANEADAWAVLRDAQAKALSLPHTAMAVGLDAGEWNDLHPLDKKTIGTRLFLAVEKLVFGEENSSPGPVPESWETVLSGDSSPAALRIRFTNCAGGLTAKGDITITLGAGNELRERPAVIEGADTLIVPMEDFRPERVLYAWANTPRGAGIYNTEGLPAPPFRIMV
ncbi:MAG: sialate O-acetylesterase, partial [Spirochaetaceae bacterium]|nr:sialate O-acetylesterase [Spirochaetaceae bacterium]